MMIYVFRSIEIFRFFLFFSRNRRFFGKSKEIPHVAHIFLLTICNNVCNFHYFLFAHSALFTTEVGSAQTYFLADLIIFLHFNYVRKS